MTETLLHDDIQKWRRCAVHLFCGQIQANFCHGFTRFIMGRSGRLYMLYGLRALWPRLLCENIQNFDAVTRNLLCCWIKQIFAG